MMDQNPRNAREDQIKSVDESREGKGRGDAAPKKSVESPLPQPFPSLGVEETAADWEGKGNETREKKRGEEVRRAMKRTNECGVGHGTAANPQCTVSRCVRRGRGRVGCRFES